MQPSSIDLVWKDVTMLSITRHTQKTHCFFFTERTIGQRELPIDEDTFPTYCTQLGSKITVLSSGQPRKYTRVWELQLERSPNATQFAAFMEMLYANLRQNEYT